MNPLSILPIVTCLAAVSLAAAQTATLTVSHNDPDGLVAPGQTVQVTATLAWTGNSGLGYVGGDVRATGDLGVASNPSFPYVVTYPEAIILPGTPFEGSVLEVYIESADASPFFGLPPLYPFGLRTGLILTRFDWTAPSTVGVVEFAWVPDPADPLPIMSPVGGFSAVPYPTTYFGTSLTVVPAPASALLMASGLLAVMCRQRP